MNLEEKDMRIIEQGTKALIQELGYSGFLKYISRVQLYKEGYLRAQERVYRDTADEECAGDNNI